MSDSELSLISIEKMANENGPIGYIKEQLKTSKTDSRYVNKAVRIRVQQVETANYGKPISRKITAEELLSCCLEFEKYNVTRIAFENMIPNYKRVRSKRIPSLKNAHKRVIKILEDLETKIIAGCETYATPEYPDTWNCVIRLDAKLLDEYIRLTNLCRSFADLTPDHLHYFANGTHPILIDIEERLGSGSVQLLKDIGILLLSYSDVREHLHNIWNNASVAESIMQNPIITKELRYFSRLRLYYGPGGKYSGSIKKNT